MSSAIEEQSPFFFNSLSIPTFSQLRKMTNYSFDPLAEAINESSSAFHHTVTKSCSATNNASNSSHYSERSHLYAIKDAEFHGRRRKQRKKEGDEAPVGYIHVRARRGQATDSHSLAERVRREKISERMKVLQGLVPGCEKVVGKAMMLDEIINYVQSLQNQVEFLSMKLACVNPMMFDLSDDCYCLVNQTQLMPSSLLQSSFDQGTCKGYETMMNHAPVLLQHQGSFSLSQENVSLWMQIPDERQDLTLNNIVLNNNMCLFQQGSKGEGPY